MVKSSGDFENGCIPMHCGARVMFDVSDVVVESTCSNFKTG